MKRSNAPSKLLQPCKETDKHFVSHLANTKRPKFVVPLKTISTNTPPATQVEEIECYRPEPTGDIGNGHFNVQKSPIEYQTRPVPTSIGKSKPKTPAFAVPSKSPRNIEPTHQQLTSTNVVDGKLDAAYFNVIWCKRSTKKHKKWEGDGVLIVSGKSATLIDNEGKKIGCSSGYKKVELSSLKHGETLCIASKEIEIMGTIPAENFLSGKCFQTVSQPTSEQVAGPKNPAMVKPFIKHNSKGVAMTKRFLQARFDPTAEGALVLSRPPLSNNSCTEDQEVVDVVVDPYLSRHLRPHQREGVDFLYKCIMGFSAPGHGAILADDMGLGKTLQIIALLWTLLKQNPISSKPVIKRAIVVTPSSLVQNWQAEFHKWLGSERLNVFAVSSDKKAQEFKNACVYPVMIVSYEMFLRYSDDIKETNFDIIICDEGHRLKNSNIKTASVLLSISTRRRIVVTGTPIQNDLKEFFTLSDFTNPACLGTASSFRKVYEEPIVASRSSDCSTEEKSLGEERAQELMRLTSTFVLRRTNEVNQRYLPPKTEYVVFCKPTRAQLIRYRSLVNSLAVRSLLTNSLDPAQALTWINDLKKICNYPPLVSLIDGQHCSLNTDTTRVAELPEDSGCNRDDRLDVSLSGKLMVTKHLLDEMHSENKTSKIVLVSNYTKTLDVLVRLCESLDYQYLRLDGQTQVSKRVDLVNTFNSNYSTQRVFLLSSKAGGVGLNLVGANRLVLFDMDWNPANDLQAMARIWRDGQKRPVSIYRLITSGTIEEKIYQRQLSKQSIGGTIMESMNQHNDVQFSREDLRDLFTLREDTDCETHEIIGCECQGKTNSISNPSILDGVVKGQLVGWKHFPAVKIPADVLKESLLMDCQENLGYLFVSQSPA